MFIATVVAALTLGVAKIDDTPLKCAVMGSPTNAKSMTMEYAGAKYPMCCGGCPDAFKKEPTKYIKEAAKSNTTIGMTLFCPVSGEKLDMEKVKATIDYKGMRYGFCCNDCVTAFKADPAKFAKTPEKESMTCPVSGEKIAAYSAAAGFMDYKGVRYYFCCGDCMSAMKKDPDAVIAKGKAAVAEPHVVVPAKKDGN